MKIAVGTTSKQKLGYLKEILKEIGIVAKVIPVSITAKISEQPTTENETEQGSLNRAKEALKKVPNADFSMGIEVGYHKNSKDIYEMFSCSSIIDRESVVKSCFSSKLALPEYHQKILKNKKYLGKYVKDYKKNNNKPVTNYTREVIRNRKPFITEAVRNSLLLYLEGSSS